MAGTSGVLSSSEQIQANYEKYKSKFKDATENMVSSDTFLSLLVAEMTNQDPMEPTSNTEFVTQMAQFTSLQYSKDAATYSQSNYASSLVGKTVTASKMDGSKQVTKTGVVQSVMKNGDKYTLKIDGVSFELSNITSISESASSDTGSSNTSLGELIAKASTMIGMSATVNPTVNGGSLLDSGIITSIQVKDGQVRVIINDKGYALDDIVEVAYPIIETEPDDKTDDAGKTDTESKADDTASADKTDDTDDSDKIDESVIDPDDGVITDAELDLIIEEHRRKAEESQNDNVNEMMAAVDAMNSAARAETSALYEDTEEVTQPVTPDDYIADDIADLEDLI